MGATELMTELFDKAPKVKRTAHEVIAMLEKKYCAPSWAFFTEVKNSVGFGNRRADGIAVAMWRSLGLEIHGFEVKCSRADWLNELKDGSKSEEIFKYCNRWWIVAADDSIVRDGELPPTWGLQIPNGRGMRIVTKAPKLTPEPLTVWFVAEVLRRSFDSQKRPEALDLEYERGRQRGKEEAQRLDLKYELEQSDKLKKAVEQFEKASGLQINTWQDSKELGAAVSAVLHDGPKRILQNMEYAQSEVEHTLKQITEAVKAIRSFDSAQTSTCENRVIPKENLP
jgi:hypothetical protein